MVFWWVIDLAMIINNCYYSYKLKIMNFLWLSLSIDLKGLLIELKTSIQSVYALFMLLPQTPFSGSPSFYYDSKAWVYCCFCCTLDFVTDSQTMVITYLKLISFVSLKFCKLQRTNEPTSHGSWTVFIYSAYRYTQKPSAWFPICLFC